MTRDEIQNNLNILCFGAKSEMEVDNAFMKLLTFFDSCEAIGKSCNECKHYSAGNQSDGLPWSKCEYHFDCSVAHNSLFEQKDTEC